MTDATIVVEIAFQSPPGTPDSQVVWEAVTTDVRSMGPVRGRAHELDKYSAGTISIVLSNLTRQYDPTNLAGPHVAAGATLVLPMRRLRVRATGTVTAPIFDGYIDGWQQNFDGKDLICVVTATDGFKILVKSGLTGSPFSIDSTRLISPKYWFRLGEAVGSTTATDQQQGAALTKFGKTGVFGAAGLVALDSDTAYTQTGGMVADRLSSTTVGVVAAGSGQWLQMQQNNTAGDTYNGVTTPDTTAPDSLAAMDFRIRTVMPSTTLTGFRWYFGKGGYGSTRGWYMGSSTSGSGTLLEWVDNSAAGGTFVAVSPIIPVAAGTAIWFGYTVAFSTGTTKLYYNTAASPAADITTWTLLSTTASSTASTDSGSNALLPAIGSRGFSTTTDASQGGSSIQEPIYNVAVRNAINGSLLYNPDFTDPAQWTVGGAGTATGTDSTGKVWTIRNSSGGSPSPTVTGTTQPFTFSVWANASQVIALATLASGGPPATGWDLTMTAASKMVFTITSALSSSTVTGGITMVAGTTYHVVISYSATGVMTLYMNGVVDAATTTSARTLSSNGLTLGNIAQVTGSIQLPWAGTIDEVQYYDSELTAAQVLAIYAAGTTPWVGDTADVRIGRILDSVGWPTLLRDLDVGVEPLQSAALTGSALDYAQLAAQSELFGSFFITRDGKAAFRNRARLYDQSIVATFSDASAANNPVMNMTPDYGDWLLRNDVTVGRSGGVDASKTNAASIANFLDQAYSVTGLMHSNDSHSVAAARLLVSAYAQPQLRVDQVVVNMRAAGVTQSDVLGLELGSWINLIWKPRGTGAQITLTCVVEQIKHDISLGGKNWLVTLTLSPALVNGHMKFQGKLGSSTSTLAASIGTVGATSISVAHSGASWTDSFQPFTIQIDSEQMTVTAVVTSQGASPQTFTVVRGVNGTTAATHVSGTVTLAAPSKLILA